MNALDAILGAQNGAVVEQLGQQFGLDQQQTSAAVAALVPALAAGLQRNAGSDDGLASLLGALASGGHTRYVDDVSQLGRQETVNEGNGILGHILGSRDVSRQVATRAAAQTGISPDLLKQMLPVLASILMGTLAKQTTAGSGGPGLRADAGSSIFDMLTPMLDRNRDGSVVDDVIGMVGKVLGGR
jgi:hypothetical protein